MHRLHSAWNNPRRDPSRRITEFERSLRRLYAGLRCVDCIMQGIISTEIKLTAPKINGGPEEAAKTVVLVYRYAARCYGANELAPL
jgi:hypothetical protein